MRLDLKIVFKTRQELETAIEDFLIESYKSNMVVTEPRYSYDYQFVDTDNLYHSEEDGELKVVKPPEN